MNLVFYKGRYGTIWDKLICMVTRSEFSHVELSFTTEGSIQRCWSSSTRDGGVRQAYIDISTGHWLVLPIPATISEKLFLQEQRRAYDYVGLLGTVFKTSIFNSRHKWFCSEIVAEALGCKDAWKQTPESLYRLYYENSGAN